MAPGGLAAGGPSVGSEGCAYPRFGRRENSVPVSRRARSTPGRGP
jgi:hypothetical protein